MTLDHKSALDKKAERFAKRHDLNLDPPPFIRRHEELLFLIEGNSDLSRLWNRIIKRTIK